MKPWFWLNATWVHDMSTANVKLTYTLSHDSWSRCWIWKDFPQSNSHIDQMRKLRPVLVFKVAGMRLVVLAPGQYFSVSTTFWVFGEVGWPFIRLTWGWQIISFVSSKFLSSCPHWIAYQGFSFFTHSLEVSQELLRPWGPGELDRAAVLDYVG